MDSSQKPRPWLKALAWIGTGMLLPIVVGLVLLVVQTRTPLGQQPSRLKVAAVDIQEARIPVTANDGKEAKFKGSVIDVVIKNTGPSASLITRADFVFREAQQLEGCPSVSGPLVISALYDVRVPTGPPKREPPFTLHRPMRYEVRSNTYERFAFKIGPEIMRDGDWPWVYEVDISLRYNESQSLFVARVLLLEPGDNDWIIQSTRNTISRGFPPVTVCLQRNVDLMQNMIDSKGLLSPYLVSFHNEIQKLIKPQQIAAPTTLPTPGTSLSTPEKLEKLYGAEAGAACRREHETLSEVFNQLFEKYGSHAAFPGPGENSDGDRYAAGYRRLANCLARFGVPPPSY
jgi:hypothetical protein